MSCSFSLIAVHGNGGGGFRFERIEPFVPADVRFLAPTLPGFDDVPQDCSLRTLKDYAFKLREMIRHVPSPIVMLGTGIGGSIVLEFAQHFESDARALILHAPVGARLKTRLFPNLMKPPWARRLGQRLFSSKLARPIFSSLLFESPQNIPPDYLRRFFEAYRQCAAFAQMFDIITDEWFRSLRPINAPSALLWGEKERVLTPDQARDYQKLLPNSVIRLVPNWNHFPMIEQPEAFARETLNLARDLLQK